MIKIFRLILLTFLFLFLTACGTNSAKNLDIKLISDTFEVGSISSACESIENINGKPVTSYDLKNHTVFAGEVSIKCSTTKLDEIGEALLVFDGLGQSRKIRVNIVDNTPPVIHLDNEKLHVEVGNEYFNLDKLITVTDNYEENVELKKQGAFDIDKVGTYRLKLMAQDSSGNKATKNVDITVNEKEVVTIVEERPVYIEDKKPNDKAASNSPSIKSNNESSPNHNPSPKPNNKKYLFKDGYDIQSAPNACQSDLKKAYNAGWGGGCYPIEGDDGYAVGMELKIFE